MYREKNDLSVRVDEGRARVWTLFFIQSSRELICSIVTIESQYVSCHHGTIFYLSTLCFDED